MITIGIDPGAKYTGVSVRDIANDLILLSSTYVKPDDMPLVYWSICLGDLIEEEVIALYPKAPIGLEGVSDPKGYNNGKKSPINPKYLVRAGVVMGSLASRFRDKTVIVPPGHNGTSRTGYPDVLNGRRPKDLPGQAKGAGTRNHEKSAYDIAGEVPFLVANKFTLDAKNEL